MVSSWLVWNDFAAASKWWKIMSSCQVNFWGYSADTISISCHKVFGFLKSSRCIFAFITSRDCWKIPPRNQTEQFQMISNWRRQHLAGGKGFRSTVRGHLVYIENIVFPFHYLTISKQFDYIQKAIEMDRLSQASFLVLDWKRKKDRRLFWGGAIPCSTALLQ